MIFWIDRPEAKKKKFFVHMEVVVEKPVQVVGYCRVSSTLQEKDGASLSLQQQKIKMYYEQSHFAEFELVWIFDVVSGKNIHKQPQLQKCIQENIQKSHVKAIFVYHASRLTRNYSQGIELIESLSGKTCFISISEGLDSRFDVQGWKDALKEAENERLLLGKRIRDGFEEKKRLGGCYLSSGLKSLDSVLFAPFERRYIEVPFPDREAFVKIPKLFITENGKKIAEIICQYVHLPKSEAMFKLFSHLQAEMPIHETTDTKIAYSVTRKLGIDEVISVLRQWNPSISWSTLLVSRLLLWIEQ